tara:strand:- start:456 stop:608 length:153 start_codon:yes stop_codon:yes gene_type:complete
MNKNSLPKYVEDLVKKYPKIISGRKNFLHFNARINETLKLIRKFYKKTNN